MIKKYTLVISTLYLVFFIGIFVLDSICHSSWCRIQDDDFFGRVFFFCLPLLPVFFFSLITYRLPEQVFQAWWRVAVWFVPLLIVITYFLNSSHQQSGFGGVAQGSFYFAIQFFLYTAFIFTSLIKIFFAWRRVKGSSQ